MQSLSEAGVSLINNIPSLLRVRQNGRIDIISTIMVFAIQQTEEWS